MSLSDRRSDVAVIGAGLIGLSTAMQLLGRRPGLRVIVIEKDGHPASQQSGHNSGVIHSGIYYRPGSFKARFSVDGRASMLRFCAENDVPTATPGKLIVATKADEVPRLETLAVRGQQNGVEGLELIGPERAREIEPHVRAVRALWSPGTAVVDFGQVARVYARKVVEFGGTVEYDARVVSISRRDGATVLATTAGDVIASAIVNCAGLHADRVARMAGVEPGLRIIPFRGEYYRLRPARDRLVRGLIYPVPDPAFPFLGVHFTRTMDGFVEAGPNAVLATRREGYTRRDFSARDVAGMLSYPGFWHMAFREWRTGLQEIHRSLRKSVFVRSLQALVPEVTAGDLDTGASGVRAQAVDPRGILLDDFAITQSPEAVHVLNAPSPGATSSLTIGRHIVDLAMEAFAIS